MLHGPFSLSLCFSIIFCLILYSVCVKLIIKHLTWLGHRCLVVAPESAHKNQKYNFSFIWCPELGFCSVLECESAFNLCTGGQHFSHLHTHIEFSLLFECLRTTRPQKYFGILVSLPVPMHPSIQISSSHFPYFSLYLSLIYLFCRQLEQQEREKCCESIQMRTIPFKSLISF